jgi:hypothetical protein
MYSFTVYEEVLVRRGIIASAHRRVTGAGRLDVENHHEIAVLLREIEPRLMGEIRPGETIAARRQRTPPHNGCEAAPSRIRLETAAPHECGAAEASRPV